MHLIKTVAAATQAPEFTEVDKALLRATTAQSVSDVAQAVRTKITFPDTYTLQDAFDAGKTAVQTEVLLAATRLEKRYEQVRANHRPGKKPLDLRRVGLILFFGMCTILATLDEQHQEVVGVFALITGALVGRELGIRNRL